VFVRVVLACLLRMMDGLVQMALRDVAMMAGLFVLTGFVVFGGCPMVAGGLFMMLSSFAMMFGALGGHVVRPPLNDTAESLRWNYGVMNIA